jgi:acetoacetyl-[acyl-carrier protein] synthase
MLQKRHGEKAMADYLRKRETSSASAQNYFERADRGDYAPIYRFGEGMIADEDIAIDRRTVTIKGLANAIALPQTSHYDDMKP